MDNYHLTSNTDRVISSTIKVTECSIIHELSKCHKFYFLFAEIKYPVLSTESILCKMAADRGFNKLSTDDTSDLAVNLWLSMDRFLLLHIWYTTDSDDSTGKTNGITPVLSRPG